MINQLEPGIRALVNHFVASGRPCLSTQTVAERREGYIASTVLAGIGPEMAEEYVDELQGIQLKIFKPAHDILLPITIYFHGGCFISGGFETHAQQLRQLAQSSHSLVICLQYRLAPEFCYPTAHDDVYNAVLAIKAQGSKYGGDTSRIAFVGDSAGAQLALITSLRLKARQNWLPNKQILLYPMLDPEGKSETYRTNGKDYVITANALLSGFSMYIGDQHPARNNPELYPLACSDLSGLPPTYIITAEFDPLRDEGEQLYKTLLSEDVEVYCERYLGVIHGFCQLSDVSQSAVRCLNHIAEVLKY